MILDFIRELGFCKFSLLFPTQNKFIRELGYCKFLLLFPTQNNEYHVLLTIFVK